MIKASDQLHLMLPTTEIVRVNREHLTIRLATDEEVMKLHHGIVPDREPEMVINDRRFVAFDKSAGEFCHTDISLLGDRSSGCACVTPQEAKSPGDGAFCSCRKGVDLMNLCSLIDVVKQDILRISINTF